MQTQPHFPLFVFGLGLVHRDARTPSLKTVRDLIYKHGRGRVNDKSVALSDNLLVEKQLGKHNVICLEVSCSMRVFVRMCASVCACVCACACVCVQVFVHVFVFLSFCLSRLRFKMLVSPIWPFHSPPPLSCTQDIVHEIATVGKAFQPVTKFLEPFKLKRPQASRNMERRQFYSVSASSVPLPSPFARRS